MARDPLEPRPTDSVNYAGDVQWNWRRVDPSWHPTELLPRLWQGGTPDDDLLVEPGFVTSPWAPSVSLADFDACVTLTPIAAPAGAGVAEMRVTFQDAEVVKPRLDLLAEAIGWARRRHKSGDRVLIRCHAGLTRSGLVAVPLMTWLEPSLSFDDALALARSRRHRLVLSRFKEQARALSRPGSC